MIKNRNSKIERLLKKSHIDLDKNENISVEQFELFLNGLEEHFKESRQRIELLERSIAISSVEIRDYKTSLDQTRSMALQTSKMAAIGEMASNISHEINNPLSIISGSVEVISKVVGNLACDDRSKGIILKYADMIQNTTCRVSKIIIGLKRLSNSKMEYQYKKEKIIDVIEESFSMGLENLKALRINFEFNYSKELKNLVVAIPSVEFSQVVINLFTNAKQALEGWETNEKKLFQINCLLEKDIFKIEFINDGPKVPTEIEEKIFESFYTTKKVGEGSGIGLSISKKIIEEMKGKLYLDTHYHSPKFVIEIPVS